MILPVYLAEFCRANRLILLFSFYLVNCIILICLFRKNSSKSYALDSLIQEVCEKINLLTVDYLKAQGNSIALNEKRQRYDSLKNLLENINQFLHHDFLTDIDCTKYCTHSDLELIDNYWPLCA